MDNFCPLFKWWNILYACQLLINLITLFFRFFTFFFIADSFAVFLMLQLVALVLPIGHDFQAEHCVVANCVVLLPLEDRAAQGWDFRAAQGWDFRASDLLACSALGHCPYLVLEAARYLRGPWQDQVHLHRMFGQQK